MKDLANVQRFVCPFFKMVRSRCSLWGSSVFLVACTAAGIKQCLLNVGDVHNKAAFEVKGEGRGFYINGKYLYTK